MYLYDDGIIVEIETFSIYTLTFNVCYSLFYSLSEPCDNVNCNHGTCSNDGGRPNCTCNNRYEGDRCDKRELNCALPCSLALV